jgi:hypothetical protein
LKAFFPQNRGYFGESTEADGEEEEQRRSNRDGEEHITILRDTMHTEPHKLQFTTYLIDMFIQVLLNTPIRLTREYFSREMGICHGPSAQQRQEHPILDRGELQHQRIDNQDSTLIIPMNTMCSKGGARNKCR